MVRIPKWMAQACLVAIACISTHADATVALELGEVDNYVRAGNSTNSDTVIGYRFQVNTDISVSALGLFDSVNNGSGFQYAHTVGLWDDNGTLLRSALINQGPCVSQDLFCYSDISAITLTAGSWYRVAASYIAGLVNGTTNTDLYAAIFLPVEDTNVLFDTALTVDTTVNAWHQDRDASILDFPDRLNPWNLSGNPVFQVTANFLFSEAGPTTPSNNVPTPSILYLLGIGLLGMAVQTRSKKDKRGA